MKKPYSKEEIQKIQRQWKGLLPDDTIADIEHELAKIYGSLNEEQVKIVKKTSPKYGKLTIIGELCTALRFQHFFSANPSTIEINGIKLTESQAITLYDALGSFENDLLENNEFGQEVVKIYLDRIGEIRSYFAKTLGS